MQVGDVVYYPFGKKEGVVKRVIDNNVVVAFTSGELTILDYELEETGRHIPPCPVKAGDEVKFTQTIGKGTVIDVSIYPTNQSMYRILIASPMKNGCLNEYQYMDENSVVKAYKYRS